MSAGFPGDDPWGDRQQDLDPDAFSEFLEGGQSFAFMPGTAFEYSNLGYAILGRVITNVTGQEYRDVVRSRVLEPLGMTSTGYEAAAFPAERLATGYARRDDAFVEEPFAGYGAFASMGGLFSTVRDLARWVDGFARAFAPRGRRRTSAVARVPPGDAAGPSDDRSGADVDLRRRAPDRGRDGVRVRNVRPIRHGARNGRRAQRRLPGVRLAHAVASRLRRGRRGAGQPDVLPRAQDRRPDAAGAGSRRSCPDPSPDARARARGRARRGRASARGMGRRPRRGHVLDERRHGRTARATPSGVRSSPRDARTVASLR